MGAPLARELLGAADPERDGDGLAEGDLLGDGEGLGEGELLGDGDLLGDGEGLGEGDLLGDGEGLGEGDLLGDGEGLGEGDLLGEGESDLVEWLEDGEGAPMATEDRPARAGLAAAPVLPRTATRIPAAAAPPPASARALARALPGARPR